MADKQIREAVDGVVGCEMCGNDDAENAFWDEFVKQEEVSMGSLDETGDYTVRFVDEVTGEEWEFDGVLGEREVLKWD